MRKLLILNGQYLPGYKGGGPIRSMQNMVENLQEEYEFYILTADRDYKATEPYKNIESNTWINMNKYKVYYMTPDKQTLKGFKEIINSIDYDSLYLNGFFSPIFTIKPLILRKLNLLKNKNITICARGDFSKGHLEIKRLKKMMYIRLVKIIGLYRNVLWHATSKLEIHDLKNIFNNLKYIYAPNLSSKPNNTIKIKTMEKEANKVKLIFISRICVKKNLIYALELLKNIDKEIHICFDVYGPKEDIEYWSKCERIIAELPSNIKVNYKGELVPIDIPKVYRVYDAFLFPTLGENYGHVIVESICNGCIPIISDQTPWRNLEENKVGFDINLNDRNRFLKAIEKIARMDLKELIEWKKNNIDFYNKSIINEADLELNRKMLNGV